MSMNIDLDWLPVSGNIGGKLFGSPRLIQEITLKITVLVQVTILSPNVNCIYNFSRDNFEADNL
jgi:hypothetical protein